MYISPLLGLYCCFIWSHSYPLDLHLIFSAEMFWHIASLSLILFSKSILDERPQSSMLKTSLSSSVSTLRWSKKDHPKFCCWHVSRYFYSVFCHQMDSSSRMRMGTHFLTIRRTLVIWRTPGTNSNWGFANSEPTRIASQWASKEKMETCQHYEGKLIPQFIFNMNLTICVLVKALGVAGPA